MRLSAAVDYLFLLVALLILVGSLSVSTLGAKYFGIGFLVAGLLALVALKIWKRQ